jgi:hypothetical protein
MISEPSRRISACSRPTALLAASSERNELEQTSSAAIGLGAAWPAAAHLVQDHGHAGIGDLPGSLGTGKAAADMNGFQVMAGARRRRRCGPANVPAASAGVFGASWRELRSGARSSKPDAECPAVDADVGEFAVAQRVFVQALIVALPLLDEATSAVSMTVLSRRSGLAGGLARRNIGICWNMKNANAGCTKLNAYLKQLKCKQKN